MTAPNSGVDPDGAGRTVGGDVRVTHAARELAREFWRGGSDEQYHFLLWMCGNVARVVQDATDEFDRRGTQDGP